MFDPKIYDFSILKHFFCILDHACSQLNIFILTLQTSLSWCLGPSLNSHSTYQIIGTMLYVADLQTLKTPSKTLETKVKINQGSIHAH